MHLVQVGPLSTGLDRASALQEDPSKAAIRRIRCGCSWTRRRGHAAWRSGIEAAIVGERPERDSRCASRQFVRCRRDPASGADPDPALGPGASGYRLCLGHGLDRDLLVPGMWRPDAGSLRTHPHLAVRPRLRCRGPGVSGATDGLGRLHRCAAGRARSGAKHACRQSDPDARRAAGPSHPYFLDQASGSAARGSHRRQLPSPRWSSHSVSSVPCRRSSPSCSSARCRFKLFGTVSTRKKGRRTRLGLACSCRPRR